MKVMTVCILLFAIAIGTATFIENDYGTPAASVLIYKAKWFEFLLLLLAFNLVVNIFRMNMFRKEKLTVLIFHVAFIIILIGAGITRYTSYEGVMHIRENESSDYIFTNDSYINIIAQYKDTLIEHSEEVLYTNITKAKYNDEFDLGEKKLNIEVTHFIPDAQEKLFEAENGVPILSIVIPGQQGRQIIFLKENEARNIEGRIFSFEDLPDSSYVNIEYENGELTYTAPYRVESMQMANQIRDISEVRVKTPLNLRTLYNFNGLNMVFNDFKVKAVVKFVPGGIKPKNEIDDAVVIKVTSGNYTNDMIIMGNKGRIGAFKQKIVNGINISVAYGSKIIKLPFSIRLIDFQMERYPGSNSPSSYASEIILTDKNGKQNNYRIFMNNVLNNDGYRFFQSSYDQDELGTYLSVNHDYWGTLVTYIGYILLASGMFLTIFSKHSRFRLLSNRLNKLKAQKTVKVITMLVIMSLLFPFTGNTQSLPDTLNVVSVEHASKFAKVLAQDYQGRVKPINTLSNELIRKIAGRSELFGLNPDQIILSMMMNPGVWQNMPMIKVGHPELQSILGMKGKYATFSNIYSYEGYKLSSLVEKANNTKPIQRSNIDKEVIKIDEAFNLCYFIYTDEILKVFPIPDDENNKWLTSSGGTVENFGESEVFVKNYFNLYITTLRECQITSEWSKADETLGYLNTFQAKYGKAIFPSQSKINWEIRYNEWQIFKKLRNYYGLIGSLLLIVFLIRIFNPEKKFKIVIISGTALLILLFLGHTIGLIIRWYISNHAPWSNGYESMIYIGWATMLAGFIFLRRSYITLPITAVLTFFILLVAGFNWLDPEITNLVPVLNSYWLMIHVSIITASYGFFALACLLAFFNMVLMIFTRKNSREKTHITLSELTIIIELTMMIGLFMLTIGTFLGGVWANESWGRYWGWDAKETWAFVSILIYSFILHMRFVPLLAGKFAFNFAALIGFSTIIMTYFGVNYYLSGLHSYAAGDSVPIPTFVYYTITIVFIVSILAYWNQRKLKNKKIG